MLQRTNFVSKSLQSREGHLLVAAEFFTSLEALIIEVRNYYSSAEKEAFSLTECIVNPDVGSNEGCFRKTQKFLMKPKTTKLFYEENKN